MSLAKLGVAAIVTTASVAAAPVVGQVAGVDVGDYLIKLGPLGVLVWIVYVFLADSKAEREAFLQFMGEEREGRARVMDAMRQAIVDNTTQLHEIKLALVRDGVEIPRRAEA